MQEGSRRGARACGTQMGDLWDGAFALGTYLAGGWGCFIAAWRVRRSCASVLIPVKAVDGAHLLADVLGLEIEAI